MLKHWFIQGGHQGRPGPFFFHFHAVEHLEKLVGAPPLWLAPPPLGIPESGTVKVTTGLDEFFFKGIL